jgi:hypothetical protein
MVFNTPCNFFLGLFDLIFISFVENLEEVWVNLEVVFSNLEMVLGVRVLTNNQTELLSEVINLVSDLLLFAISKRKSVIFLSSQLGELDRVNSWVGDILSERLFGFDCNSQ